MICQRLRKHMMSSKVWSFTWLFSGRPPLSFGRKQDANTLAFAVKVGCWNTIAPLPLLPSESCDLLSNKKCLSGKVKQRLFLGIWIHNQDLPCQPIPILAERQCKKIDQLVILFTGFMFFLIVNKLQTKKTKPTYLYLQWPTVLHRLTCSFVMMKFILRTLSRCCKYPLEHQLNINPVHNKYSYFPKTTVLNFLAFKKMKLYIRGDILCFFPFPPEPEYEHLFFSLGTSGLRKEQHR